MTFAVGALGVGTTVHFNCISGKYVAEVWTCFTLEKEQIDCPDNLQTTCASEVTFDKPQESYKSSIAAA